MKRLLCILSSMNAGGAETFLMKIYRNIDRTKFQMDFCINVDGKCFYEEEILGMGGRIFRIPSKSENLKEFKQQLSDIVRDNKYLYVLRITSSAMGFMDLKIAKRAGAKKCCARSSNASDGNSFKSLIYHKLGRMLYSKFVDVKIAPSDLAAKYTFGEKSFKKGKVNILHNGVDLSVYRYRDEERNNIRKELFVSQNIKLIGHIGRFDEQKNHMFLLDIFQKIHLKDADAKLLLVGTGKLEGVIRDKAKALGIYDSIIFAGLRSDVPTLLSAMDVFVLPSFYEGMPNTVIEAQATGLPCVISDTITKEADITGLVRYLPLGDPNEWAEISLAQVSKRKSNVQELFAEKGYDIGTVVQDFVRFIFND